MRPWDGVWGSLSSDYKRIPELGRVSVALPDGCAGGGRREVYGFVVCGRWYKLPTFIGYGCASDLHTIKQFSQAMHCFARMDYNSGLYEVHQHKSEIS